MVYRPFMIPGQEERNAEFLLEAGAGSQADNIDDLKHCVYETLLNQERLGQMRANAIKHGRPDAAVDVIKTLEDKSR